MEIRVCARMRGWICDRNGERICAGKGDLGKGNLCWEGIWGWGICARMSICAGRGDLLERTYAEREKICARRGICGRGFA